jgi:hypothetical protein
MGKIAEFSKVEDVVDWYESQEIPCYAIFHDKQLRGRYVPEADDDDAMDPDGLKLALDKLMNSGSYAIYTLCVYDDPKGAIKNNTPYDVSVNFQFNRNSSPGAMGSTDRGYNNLTYTQLAVENALLKEQVKQLQEELDSPDETEMGGAMGMIDKLSQLPGMDQVIGAIAARLAGILTPTGNRPQPIEEPQPSAHFNTGTRGEYQARGLSGVPMEDARRIDVALNELSASVRDLPDILEKLVKMSRKQPLKFTLYIATLRKMNI